MKKILYSVMALAIAAMTFTACEDVPEPYPIPTADGGGGTEYTYEGNGTLESPYTCADAIHYVKSLGQAESENEVYVKGFITSITDEFTTQHGTASFVMSDTKEGTNEFTFWRCPYLGNKKFVNGDTQIKVGDEVIVYGKVVNYKGNTPETVQGAAFLYSLNGVTAGGNTPEPVGEAKGSGTLEDPFNAAAAIAYAKEVGEKESDKEVYIKGKVSSIAEQYGTEYGNGSFSLSDDGEPTGEFYVHRALYLGNQRYTGGDLLKLKDEVIVCGKVYNYKGNTPETVQAKAYLYSLNGKTEASGGQEGGGQEGGGQEGGGQEGGGQEGGGQVSDNSITVVYGNLGLSELSGPITLSDGTTLTFSQEDGKNPPIYHSGSKIIRMYARNSVTITSDKKIASVIFNYDTYQGTAYKGNDEMYGEAGGNRITPAKDDKTVTFNNVNNTTLKVVNDFSSDGGGVQFRCTGIIINYAE